MLFDQNRLLLYAVTDRSWEGKQTLYEQIEDALRGGVTCVQLREKTLEEDTFIKEAVKVRKLCHKYGVPLIINDNVKVAISSGADGVHVGIEDHTPAEIRKIAGPDFIIGATAKTTAQAQAAEAGGANYLGVGAVFPSPTKKNAIRITSEQLREICSCVSIPAIAIGGITFSNMSELAGCGVKGIAAVSVIFAADDIQTAVRQLKDRAACIIL